MSSQEVSFKTAFILLTLLRKRFYDKTAFTWTHDQIQNETHKTNIAYQVCTV